MKYPQLVSTRAVNAISDWLVSRLEQLGVEAPQIYARFLLSLLQSSVQINDPIEYSNLETFIASRKGNNRRLHQLLGDSETLKKLTAVQCLQGIVSADQEITKIESLVDELCAKLKEIEQQNAEIGEDANKLATALLITPEQHKQPAQEDFLEEQEKINCKEFNLSTRAIGKNRIKGAVGLDTGVEQSQTNIGERKGSLVGGGAFEQEVTESDPKKRYFSAFPALSKDMDEESFRALRLHAKSLTWPVERNQSAKSTAAQISQIASDSSSSSLSQSQVTKSAGDQIYNKSAGGGGGSSGQEAGAVAKSGGVNVKRRSRRRRNQALKNKSMQQKSNHNNKFTTTIGAIGGSETAEIVGVIPKAHKGKRKERYSTPTYWDTDFEGCWEMGPDLIQEFITKQNHRNNRNRSTSESAAYAIKDLNCAEELIMDEEKQPDLAEKHKFTPMTEDLSKICYEQQLENDEEEVQQVEEQNIGDDDALVTVSELTMNMVEFLPLSAPRRLYERDICSLKVDDTAEEEHEADFAQFKAKFNSSVEALWKDAEQAEPKAEMTKVSSEKLKSLWSHYFQKQTANDAERQQGTTTDSSSISLTNQSINSLQAEFSTTSSDYYSMPSNWDEVDKALPRKMPAPNSGRGSTTPVGVFLTTSIWSEYTKPTTTTETDESFYNKVWNANKTLNQLDTQQGNKLCENTGQMNKNLLTGAEGFAPFPVSKWSEGINAGPPPPAPTTTTTMASMQQHTLAPNNAGFVDCPDSSTTGSGSTTSCSSSMYPWPHHWQTPGVIGQHAQNTVMSLTDMYARDTLDASNTSSSANSSLNSPALDSSTVPEPKVTLANHATEGNSAFMEYSRIKTLIKKTNIYLPQPPMRNTYHTANDTIRSSNENLLTSETTHFQPIRTYRDGHVFNICSAWDTIVYERSTSGFLCLGDEKYLEYKRNDNYTAEDDAALAARAGIASTAPLYAKSNCDAATSMRQEERRKILFVSNKNFVLKFRVLNNCEIGCQTEDPALVAAAAAADAAAKERINALKLTEQHPLCLLFAGGTRYGMQPRPLPNTGAACSDALNALNKAIATAAKSRTQVQQQQQQQQQQERIAHLNNNNRNNNNNSNIIMNSINKNIIENKMGKDEVDWLSATKVAQHVAAGVKNEAKCAVDCWPANEPTFTWPVYTLNKNELKVVQKEIANADQVKEKENDDHVSTITNSNKELKNVVDDAIAKHDYNNDVDDDDDDGHADDNIKNNNDVADVDIDENNFISCCEEVDYCLSGKKSPWSMRAIGKKCQLNEQTKRKRLNINKNNNNNDVEDGDDHTLWGMCAACHSENKSLSLPANRLLRDELNQEADEIMNELKNMQDLYIGRNDATDDEEENEHNLMQTYNDNEDEQQVTGNWCNYSPIIINQQQQAKNEYDKPNKVLQQMNRFIEDWLRPSTFQGEKYEFWHTNKVKAVNTVVDDDNSTADGVVEVVVVDVVDKKPNISSIWHVSNNPQSNIWQTIEECTDIAMQLDAEDKEIENQQQQQQQQQQHVEKNELVDAWKPLEFLRQLNVVETPAQQSKDDTFLSKLSWEHEHLAAIWKNTTPIPAVGVDNKWAVLDKNNKNRNIIMPPKNFQDHPQQEQEQKREHNLDMEKQQSERVRAFLQHLGVLNQKDAILTAKQAIESSPTTTITVATTTNNTPKTTVGNRKRRHSESLNYLELMEDHMLFCTTHNNNMLLNNDNNNVFFLQNNNNKTGNGNGNGKYNETDIDGITKMDTNLANDFGDMKKDIIDNDGGNNNDAVVIANNNNFGNFDEKHQTIITCKYWATATDNKNNDNNTSNGNIDVNKELINSFAMDEDAAVAQRTCQFDKKNASILRHVTTEIVARPLTR